jgi:acetyl-CoA carboxylase biotin carboxylase subunit
MSNIIAAEITNADAIHQDMVSYLKILNFLNLSEHGIKFIGASPEMIDRMGASANRL